MECDDVTRESSFVRFKRGSSAVSRAWNGKGASSSSLSSCAGRRRRSSEIYETRGSGLLDVKRRVDNRRFALIIMHSRADAARPSWRASTADRVCMLIRYLREWFNARSGLRCARVDNQRGRPSFLRRRARDTGITRYRATPLLRERILAIPVSRYSQMSSQSCRRRYATRRRRGVSTTSAIVRSARTLRCDL